MKNFGLVLVISGVFLRDPSRYLNGVFDKDKDNCYTIIF